jgi:hypothetical protein
MYLERIHGKRLGLGGVRAISTLFSLMLIAMAMIPSAAAQSPVISKVSKISTQQFQTITITGSGFGTHKAYTGNSDYISLLDKTKSWQAGYKGCLLGFCTTDTVTLIVHKWTDTKIVLGGFSGAWGTDDYTLNKGDSEQIAVFNPQTSAGPGTATVTISGETTTTTLTSAPNPSEVDESVVFTATVDSGAGAPPDGETVTFMQGKTKLATEKLSDGKATFTTSKLVKGTHTITAEYPGDSDFDSSTSKAVKQEVE